MLLESITPIRLYYYMLIVIFFISLFIDIFLSIKNKKIRTFTFSNWGFFLLIVILLIAVMPIRRGINMDEWGNTFNLIHRIVWIMTPLIIFIYVRLKSSNDFEKPSNGYVDIFSYFGSRRRPNK